MDPDGMLGALVLIGGLGAVGWLVASRPIDPNSEVGRGYAEGFKKSFVQKCLEQVGTPDEAMREKTESVCNCGAEASYQEIKDVPVTEQYALFQQPEMQQKLASIMQDCMQSAGLQ